MRHTWDPLLQGYNAYTWTHFSLSNKIQRNHMGLKIIACMGLLWWLRHKESAYNVGNLDSIPGWGRSPGGGHGNPVQYSCLENPHGQRSLGGYSPWGCKESDLTERLSTTHMCSWGKIMDKRYKETPKNQLPLLKSLEQKQEVKSRALCMPYCT